MKRDRMFVYVNYISYSKKSKWCGKILMRFPFGDKKNVLYNDHLEYYLGEEEN